MMWWNAIFLEPSEIHATSKIHGLHACKEGRKHYNGIFSRILYFLRYLQHKLQLLKKAYSWLQSNNFICFLRKIMTIFQVNICFRNLEQVDVWIYMTTLLYSLQSLRLVMLAFLMGTIRGWKEMLGKDVGKLWNHDIGSSQKILGAYCKVQRVSPNFHWNVFA